MCKNSTTDIREKGVKIAVEVLVTLVLVELNLGRPEKLVTSHLIDLGVIATIFTEVIDDEA